MHLAALGVLVDARLIFVYDEISTGAQAGGPVLPLTDQRTIEERQDEGGKEDV
jgi:hypothetical protein